eukprot:NODE_523_length_7257_cov_0.781922.p4 type:complete len:140 gc:universal NODE_523_length_7257_cov_0.781922:6045-5626(-)
METCLVVNPLFVKCCMVNYSLSQNSIRDQKYFGFLIPLDTQPIYLKLSNLPVCPTSLHKSLAGITSTLFLIILSFGVVLTTLMSSPISVPVTLIRVTLLFSMCCLVSSPTKIFTLLINHFCYLERGMAAVDQPLNIYLF